MPNPVMPNSTLSEGIRIRVEPLDQAAWSSILTQFNDASIYQSWAYGAVHWGASQLTHVVVERDSKVIAAAQVRLMQMPVIGKGVAYLRWGPLWRLRDDPVDPALLEQVFQALKTEFVERRGLLLRVMTPDFESDTVAAGIKSGLQAAGFSEDPSAQRYRTFRVDLEPPLELLRKRLDQKWRNCLNNAQKNGLTITHGTGIELYDRFLEAYHGMMQRKQFETTVDVDQFRKMQLLLPESLKMRMFLCEKEGKLLNAMVVSAAGQTGIYLLGATSGEGLNLKGSYLLQWSVVQWLKEQGYRSYDLGGINPETNPGVYHFKQGLGGQDVRQIPVYELSGSWVSSVSVKAAERARALPSRLRKWVDSQANRSAPKTAPERSTPVPKPQV